MLPRCQEDGSSRLVVSEHLKYKKVLHGLLLMPCSFSSCLLILFRPCPPSPPLSSDLCCYISLHSALYNTPPPRRPPSPTSTPSPPSRARSVTDDGGMAEAGREAE